MNKLENKLGYTFRNKALLQEALTHSSWANENKKSGVTCNERLEFLGDAILSSTVAEFLYKSKPEMPEGLMTRVRAELVCEKSLDEAAGELELGTYLRLGRGEEQGGGRKRPSILADAFEAVVAAIFLDGGIEQAQSMLGRFVLCQYAAGGQTGYDYKTALQELIQRKSGQSLTYHMTGESGPDHAKQFVVEVRLNGTKRGEGAGKNKKAAEQAAAKIAYEEMTK